MQAQTGRIATMLISIKQTRAPLQKELPLVI